MSGKRYVPEGVYVACNKGTKISELRGIFFEETTLFGEHMCTRADKVLMVNYDPFGSCSAMNRNPCTAPVLDWTNVTDSITLGGNELLLENSELPCAIGGTIKIHYSAQSATASLPAPEEERGFWGTTWDFTKGVGNGLWNGAKGTVVGIYDVAVWAGKHSLPYMVLNPQGYQEQLQRDKEGLQAMGELAQRGGTWVYRNSTINMIANYDDYMAAQLENQQMVEGWIDAAGEMSAEDWGNLTGQGIFEVVLTVGTGGAGHATKVGRGADLISDVARGANALEDVADVGRVAENLDDVSDTAKAADNLVPEELGDVLHRVEDPPGTFRDSQGKLRDSETGEYVTDPNTPRTGGSLREEYMGSTPGKDSRTGREVIERMKGDDLVREDMDGNLIFKSEHDGNWYPIEQADMAHRTDAVTWWNETGRQYGPRSTEVREFMLDSDNYYLEHYSINRSQGASLGQNYLPPLD